MKLPRLFVHPGVSTAIARAEVRRPAWGFCGVVAVVAALSGCRHPETYSAEELAKSVETDRYVADLTFIAKERVPGSPHWKAVQDLCAKRLQELGYEVERQDYDTGTNIIGILPGTDAAAGQVIISAHYDHIQGCPGADDNATGVAGALEAARVLASAKGRFRGTLIVACWDEEERGRLGSSAYAKRAKRERGDVITAAYVFETLGYKSDKTGSQKFPREIGVVFPEQVAWVEKHDKRGDFVVLVADDGSRSATERFIRYAKKFGLPTLLLELTEGLRNVPELRDLRRSDHASFWEHNYPAVMLGDTGNFRNPNYHCKDDLIDQVSDLDHGFATRIVQATVAATVESLGLPATR